MLLLDSTGVLSEKLTYTVNIVLPVSGEGNASSDDSDGGTFFYDSRTKEFYSGALGAKFALLLI